MKHNSQRVTQTQRSSRNGATGAAQLEKTRDCAMTNAAASEKGATRANASVSIHVQPRRSCAMHVLVQVTTTLELWGMCEKMMVKISSEEA